MPRRREISFGRTQLPGQSSFKSPPTAQGGVVYRNGAGSGVTLYAVLNSNGAVLWSKTMVAGNWGSPTLSEDGVFVSFPCQVFEFDMVTGVQRWNRDGGCDGGGGVTAALYDQLLYTSEIDVNNSSTGHALLAFDGAVRGALGDLANSNAYQREGWRSLTRRRCRADTDISSTARTRWSRWKSRASLKAGPSPGRDHLACGDRRRRHSAFRLDLRPPLRAGW